MEVINLEVEGERSTMATLAWAEGSWMERLTREQKEAWRKLIFEVSGVEASVRTCRELSVCETRDLGIKWPQWLSLVFEGQESGGHESDLPAGCKEDASETSP